MNKCISDALILQGAAAMSLGAVILCAVSEPVGILFTGLAIISVAGFVFVRRNRIYGAFDPLAIFCGTFAAYNGLILVRIGMQSNPNDLDLPYPTTYPIDTYVGAGLLSLLAIITVAATMYFVQVIRRRRPQAYVQEASIPSQNRAYFIAGLGSYAIGCVLLSLQILMLGGLMAVIEMPRTERYAPTVVTALSLPYAPFIAAGLAFVAYATFGAQSNKRRSALYMLIAIWVGITLLSGGRREVVNCLLSIVVIASAFLPKLFKFKFKHLILLVAFYILFMLFGQVREVLPDLLLGKIDRKEAQSNVETKATLDGLSPEHTEFAGPFLSLLESVHLDKEPLYGKSYYQSFATVLPRAFYPGVKPLSHSHEFDERVRDLYAPTLKIAAGWGFNPVAEAYDNGAIIGVIALFTAWTLFFIVMGAIRRNQGLLLIIFALLVPEAINANRIDFRVVFTESMYQIGAALVTYVIAIVVLRGRRRTVWSPVEARVQLPMHIPE
jgi:hypothetical protein